MTQQLVVQGKRELQVAWKFGVAEDSPVGQKELVLATADTAVAAGRTSVGWGPTRHSGEEGGREVDAEGESVAELGAVVAHAQAVLPH